MSLFCISSPSKSGSVFSKLAPRQALSFLYPFKGTRSFASHSKSKGRAQDQSPWQMVSSEAVFEAWFINSLANVGYCHSHAHARGRVQNWTTFTSQRQKIVLQRQQASNPSSRRYQHTKVTQGEFFTDETPKSDPREENHLQPDRTREELLELVDQYAGESYTDQLPLLELPRLYQPSDGPFLTVSDKEEDEWPPTHCAWYADEETQAKLEQLEEALKDLENDPEETYQIYRTLPEPRAPYLEARIRHRMLHHLSVVERKDEHSMLRYLSVVDDMKGAAIPLSVSEWTSAVSFVSRYVARSTELECEAALQMWREMELVAGVKGNSATFNTLFDVACKAGKFTLAEMILKEMKSRGFEFTRYHHVSMIFYYGLQKSGDGARAAYKTLVEAGEMVDTVVLNAMISALIRSHETSAAENTYERMKRTHIENDNSALQPSDFRARRSITRTLMKMARSSKCDPEKRKLFQAKSIIAPDLHTFRILVNHYAVDLGELDKTARLLEEMKLFELPLHGALFLAIFKGFSRHGGTRYTQWTEVRLEKVWKSLLYTLKDEHGDVHLSRWMVHWILSAFAKCSGKARTLSVWQDIKKIWKPNEADLDFVMNTLRSLLEAPDQAALRYDWVLGSL